MRTYTNLTWPDDPYRTGQQLYRRPVPRLAAFTAARTVMSGRLMPSAVAIVYLPLHRTQAINVTEQTLTFGFRAASADGPGDMPALTAMADLDLMQARRHAAVLAGYLLAGDLAALRQAGDAAALRGLAAVQREWGTRGSGSWPGGHLRLRARLARDPAAGGGLPVGRDHCRSWPGRGGRQPGGDAGGGAGADDRAGLRPAPGPLRVGRNLAHRAGLAAATWDCLPQSTTEAPGGRVPLAAALSGAQTGRPHRGA